MIMSTIMIMPLAMQKRRGWTAPQIRAGIITATAMMTMTIAMATATPMPAIRMNTMPT